MKENKDLHDKLFLLLYEQFRLKTQIKNKQTNKTHLIKKIRKDILKIKNTIRTNKKLKRINDD